jgi:hypothetical protein
MIVTCKNKSGLFAQGGVTLSIDEPTSTTYPLSFCGLHTIQSDGIFKAVLKFPIDDSVKSIGNIVSDTPGKVFTAEDFEITEDTLRFKTTKTRLANRHVALVEIVKTNDGLVKKIPATYAITLDNLFEAKTFDSTADPVSNFKLTGLYGPVKSPEIIAWNVLPKLRATGKTSRIWNDAVMVTPDYTKLVGTRNPDCWIGDLDISGIPIGNTVFDVWSQANMGCLIAPQVGIGSGHWSGNFKNGIDRNLTAGRQVCFKGNDGVLHVRTIIASTNSSKWNPGVGGFSELDLARDPEQLHSNAAFGDSVIYLLNQPLPSTVRPLKFAGAWMFESESDEDNSEKKELLNVTSLNEKEFFAGMGFYINQFKLVTPIVLCVGSEQKEKLYNFRGITEQLRQRYLGGQFLFAHEFELNGMNSTLASQNVIHPILGSLAGIFRNYYTENPDEQPPPADPANFFNDPIYRRYHLTSITGDSGTPYFFEGDNGELGFVGLCSGAHPYLWHYESLPTLNRIIDDMKTFASYTGTVEYPQIMAKPTNTSKVERS